MKFYNIPEAEEYIKEHSIDYCIRWNRGLYDVSAIIKTGEDILYPVTLQGDERDDLIYKVAYEVQAHLENLELGEDSVFDYEREFEKLREESAFGQFKFEIKQNEERPGVEYVFSGIPYGIDGSRPADSQTISASGNTMYETFMKFSAQMKCKHPKCEVAVTPKETRCHACGLSWTTRLQDYLRHKEMLQCDCENSAKLLRAFQFIFNNVDADLTSNNPSGDCDLVIERRVVDDKLSTYRARIGKVAGHKMTDIVDAIEDFAKKISWGYAEVAKDED